MRGWSGCLKGIGTDDPGGVGFTELYDEPAGGDIARDV